MMRRDGAERRGWIGRWTMTAAVVLVLAACAGEGGGGPPPSLPSGVPLAIETPPELSVGVVEGDTLRELHDVRTPFLFPDGRLAVPLGEAGTIRLFGPEGKFRAHVGRPGEGPGEFSSLRSAWLRGDTVEAYDGGRRRIVRFLPDGTTEEVSLEGGRFPVDAPVPGVLPDGWATVAIVPAEDPWHGRDELAFLRLARDGSLVEEMARVEGMRRYLFPGGGGGPTPLSPRAISRVEGGKLYLAETLTPEIRVYAPEKRQIDTLSWEPGRRPDVKATLGTVVDSAAARAAPGERASLRRRLEAAPVPDRVSVFWDFAVDAEGFVWVRPFDPMGDAAALGGLGNAALGGSAPGGTWRILSPEGDRVGSVEVPERLVPAQITTDAVVGIWRDELGVESVRVYALRRR